MIPIPQQPKNSPYTPSQWEAIYASGNNILVSASAGSGKTTVLVKRVIEKIKSGTGVDELLIVTFTEAAAKEMKERIEVALKEQLEKSRGKEHQYYLQQLQRLPLANISTLHSFCLQVIQRYYYYLGIDPKFRLADDVENLLLQEEVWDTLREQFYERADFKSLVDAFSSDRNDNGLTDVLFDLVTEANTKPYPKEFLQSLPELYTPEKTKELLEQKIVPESITTLTSLQKAYQKLQLSLQGIEKVAAVDKMQEVLEEEKQQVVSLLNPLLQGDYSSFFNEKNKVSFKTLRTYQGKEEGLKELTREIKEQRDLLKKALLELTEELFKENPQTLPETTAKAHDLMETLAEVALAFLAEFKALKTTRKLLDFNDLEHFAYAILSRKVGLKDSEAPQSFYQEKFKEIMVDEYQDINLLQDAILKSVSSGDNIFMVGDVKQSIYSFRQAEPSLFIEKYLTFGENPTLGKRIILQENFRSNGEVIGFTNLVFSQLMDETVGEIPYDKAAELIQGNQNYLPDSSYETELLIYEKGKKGEKDEENPELADKTDGELALVAKRIRQLQAENFQVTDKKTGEKRPLRYEDIALLVPTRKNNLVLQETFKKFEIPIVVSDAKNYFQTTEIKTMMALLKVIDNPKQDIPLVAVLRSFIVGLTEKDLAEIRVGKLLGDYYDSLVAYQTPGALFEKVQDFLVLLADFRQYKNLHSINELVFYIYEKTGFLEYVSGLPEGLQRRENLLALGKRGQDYENLSYRGLFQFIRFIEKMEEKQEDLAQPLVLAKEDAVSVMTIHGSKGLEFPVVFLLDMNKGFNLQDLTKSVVFQKNLGIGVTFFDENRVKHTTLPYEVIKKEKQRLLLSEEMRKLYVALTRSENKLFLVGSYEDYDTLLKKWLVAKNESPLILSKELRLVNRSLMDWVGYTLIRHPKLAKETTEDIMSLPALNKVTEAFQVKSFTGKDLLYEKTTSELPVNQPIVSNLTSDAKSILAYHYPYEGETKTTSYQSVSEIKQVFVDPDATNLQLLDLENHTLKDGRYLNQGLKVPNFLQSATKVKPQEIGTASHLLLQLISLETQPTVTDFKTLANDLVAKSILKEAVVKVIPFSDLADFFVTNLGQRILSYQKTLKREAPFSMLLPGNQLFANLTTPDEILIHGIIDGVFETETGFVLYDFKTDHLNQVTTSERKEILTKRYQGQLNLYEKAVNESQNLFSKGPKKVVEEKYIVALLTHEVFSL